MSTTVTLVWNAVTTDINGQPLSAAPNYLIYRGRQADGSDLAKVAGVAATTFTEVLQSATGVYYYAVSAQLQQSEGAKSNIVAVDTTPPVQVPGAPVITVQVSVTQP